MELNYHPGELLENCLLWGKIQKHFWGQKCCEGAVVRVKGREGLPGDPVVKTLNLQCRDAAGVGLSPGWGTKIPCADLLCGVTEKKKKKTGRNKGGRLRFFLRRRSISLTNKDETLVTKR